MANPYGPWATAIDTGRNPQLSTFWRQRLTMLVPASQTSPVLTRRTLMLLCVAAVLLGLLPTLRPAPAVAKEDNPPDAEQYRFARLITAYELMKAHLAMLENPVRLSAGPPTAEETEKDKEAKTEFARYFANQMRSEAKVGAEWKVSIIRPTDRNRNSLTQFEKQALEKIRQGAEEVGQRTPSGTVRYVRPVRMQENCAQCHQAPAELQGLPGMAERPSMKVGDVIATYSLEITFKDLPGTKPDGKAANKK
jgi:hypothetical protein